MRTIPTSWKNWTTDRWLWLTSRGRPVYLVKITLPDQVIRMATKKITIYEAGSGYTEYGSRFLQSLPGLETSLEFLRGDPGAAGHLGEIQFIVSNALFEGNLKFSEEYDLEDFIGAPVDIYLTFEECAESAAPVIPTDVLKVYPGKISHYTVQGHTIKFTANDNTYAKHKNIPQRIPEFNSANTMGWTTQEKFKTAVVPFCFGTKYFKTQQCDIYSVANRSIRLAINYPTPAGIAANGYLYYWDSVRQTFLQIKSSVYSLVKHPATSLIYCNIPDLGELPIEMKNKLYLNPTWVQKLIPAEDAALTENLRDQSIDNEYYQACADGYGQQSKVPYADMWNGVYRLHWQGNFEKKLFPKDTPLNIYALADFCYLDLGSEHTSARCYVKYLIAFSGVNYYFVYQPQDFQFLTDATGPHYWRLFTIPHEYLPGRCLLSAGVYLDFSLESGYARTFTPYQTPLCTNVLADNIPSVSGLNFELYLKKTDAVARSSYLIVLELGLLVIPLHLQSDVFVLGTYGNNLFQTLMTSVLTSLVGIAAGDITFKNFLTDYIVDGEIFAETYSYDFIAAICKQLGIIYLVDEEGKECFVDMAPQTASYTITDNDLIIDADFVPDLEYGKNSEDVFSSFYVDYKLNYATGKHEKTKYVSATDHNLVYSDVPTLQALCSTALNTYGSAKRLTYKLDYTESDATAEAVLAKLVKFYATKHNIIKFKSTLRIVDLVVGDQVKFQTSFFTSANNYYVARKQLSPDGNTIDWELFECPWTAGGLTFEIAENETLPETVEAMVGAEPAETCSIPEVSEYSLV